MSEIMWFVMSEVRIKDFYAEWCGPCDQQTPIIEEIDVETGDDVVVEEIDVEQNTDEANKYGVRSIPTIIIESDEGIHKQFTGVTPKEEIINAIP